MIALYAGFIFVYLVIGFIIAVIYLKALGFHKYNTDDVMFALFGLQLLWPFTLGLMAFILVLFGWAMLIKTVSQYGRKRRE